jgi:hypothetical protein
MGGASVAQPPYGREVGAWIGKLVDEYNAGRVTEALALIPARVDTECSGCSTRSLDVSSMGG